MAANSLLKDHGILLANLPPLHMELVEASYVGPQTPEVLEYSRLYEACEDSYLNLTYWADAEEDGLAEEFINAYRVARCTFVEHLQLLCLMHGIPCPIIS